VTSSRSWHAPLSTGSAAFWNTAGPGWSGMPMTEVRDLLGHTTAKMTERYAHLAPENVRAAVTLLEGGWSRSGHAEEEEATGTRGTCR
jgi:integrase